MNYPDLVESVSGKDINIRSILIKLLNEVNNVMKYKTKQKYLENCCFYCQVLLNQIPPDSKLKPWLYRYDDLDEGYLNVVCRIGKYNGGFHIDETAIINIVNSINRLILTLNFSVDNLMKSSMKRLQK